MWGKNSSSPKSLSSPKKLSSPFQSGASETTYIAAECEFSGNITLKGNARIDGQIEGMVAITGDLVIGPSAVIKATVQANTISISGEVRGNITARETLELCSSARLYGNIYTRQLKIDQGAQFIGSSRLLEDAGDESTVDCAADCEAVDTEEITEELLEVAVNESSEPTLNNMGSHEIAVGFERPSRSKRR